MKKKTVHVSEGFTMIEIILAIALFALVALGAVSSAFFGENAQVSAGDRKRATLLGEQTIEIVRSFRDSSAGYSSLANGTYGIATSGGAWVLVPDTPDTVGDFKRSVVISSVDTTTKKITTSICWPSASCGTTVSLETYLSNWKGGALGTPGGIKIALSGEGHAYLITTNNTLQVYDISTPASPVKVGEANLAGSGDTLPTNLFYSSGKVYVSSTDSLAELQIVDVSTPASPHVVGTLNIAVDGDDFSAGDGVWADASGHVFLIARNSTNLKSQFFMIDATDPTAATMSLAGAIFTTSDTQAPGGVAEGSISSVNTMCTTAGGSVTAGYILHCYHFDFAVPSYVEVLSTANSALSPSRAVAIYGGDYFTAPGGKISVNGSTPVLISSNDIYDISAVTRSGRRYVYLAVPSDVTNALKEVDVADAANPVLITERSTDGTLSGVAFSSSTTPKYIFGGNRTGGTLGLVSAIPTPIGLMLSVSGDATAAQSISAIMKKGAGIVHCNPIVSPGTDSGCPVVYTISNVTAGSLSYAVSVSDPWVTISTASGTLAGGATTSLTVSVDATTAASLSEGSHTATVHLTFTNADGESADLVRTITLTTEPAIGIEVRTR